MYRSSAVIDSPPRGNGNARFDPGETGLIVVTVRNAGTDSADDVVCRLRSGHARFTVTDSVSDCGDLAPGQELRNRADPFEAAAASQIPPGTVVTCTLLVHCDDWDYDWTYVFSLQVGQPQIPPGTIIWGPRVCPGMPTAYGLYGLTYNTGVDRIYCCYFFDSNIYVYSSDSLLTSFGTIPAPEDSCTDIDYCPYDNTFWVLANPRKTIYKLSATGSVLRSFTISQPDYPVGLTENETDHKLYVSDRRFLNSFPLRVYVYDTLGNLLQTIDHPLQGQYGTRCLALDPGTPTNPPSLLNVFTWFNSGGTAIDSVCMYELDRLTGSVLNGHRFADAGWNIRGIEYDPRDASYWITIMQYSTQNNLVFKVSGFNPVVGTGEGTRLPMSGPQLWAWPNPFRTSVALGAPAPGPATVCLYDNNGRLIRALAADRGTSSVIWDGRDAAGRAVAPGIYFCRLTARASESWAKLVKTR